MNIFTEAKRIAALLAVAAISAPVALAGPPSSSYGHLSQEAGSPSASGSLVMPHQPATVSSSQCPCNVGLPAEPPT
jgi:hypothetical protein